MTTTETTRPRLRYGKGPLTQKIIHTEQEIPKGFVPVPMIRGTKAKSPERTYLRNLAARGWIASVKLGARAYVNKDHAEHVLLEREAQNIGETYPRLELDGDTTSTKIDRLPSTFPVPDMKFNVESRDPDMRFNISPSEPEDDWVELSVEKDHLIEIKHLLGEALEGLKIANTRIQLLRKDVEDMKKLREKVRW